MNLKALGVAFIPFSEYCCFHKSVALMKGLQYLSAGVTAGLIVGSVKAAQAYSAIFQEKGRPTGNK